MDSTHCQKSSIIYVLLGAGVLVASVFLFITNAKAQAENSDFQAAIDDLNGVAGRNFTTKDQAEDFCNQEQNWEICTDIGKKHNLYTEEEIKHVDDFLSEIKGKILDDIKSCSDEECLVRVAGELAAKIKTKNPALADSFKITKTVVEEKKAVIEAAKEAGVNLKDCESMDPDTAPVDLLRKCARLAKDARVQRYIPEEKRALADQFSDTTLVLREALAVGKYQCGDNTLDGCGKFCLNPGSTTAEIPTVCRQIAVEVFGDDGVKQLQDAHQQVGQVKNYYLDQLNLVLPDGRKLVGENQIRTACDRAFSTRDLNVARACGTFAVKNGFAAQAEVDRGLKLMESFANKAQNVSFDECLANPAACRDFIPEDERERFDVGSQIFEIMKTEIGFDPSQCERGATDPTIGTKCFEGSKRALEKIDNLGLTSQSTEAGFIVDDIRRHITEGENKNQRKDEFRQIFSQQGGPGGCKSEAECFAYCSNLINGPECIAFGAKQGVSGFQGDGAIQKFQEYNYNIQKPGLTSGQPYFPGQGPYPGFQPGAVPGQVPGFVQPGPGFNLPPGTSPYYPPYPPYPGSGSVGPSPECFAAIQSGDYAKAKTVCSTSNVSIFPYPSAQICPLSPYVECPAGQYRESYQNENGCWVDGPCKSAPTYSAGPYPTYTQYPGDQNSCPSFAYSRWDKTGARYCQLNDIKSCEFFYPAYLDRTNYSPSECPANDQPYPTSSSYPSCPSGQWWSYEQNKCTSDPTCGSGYYWDSGRQSCQPSGTYAPPGGQKEQVWNNNGLRSYIRSDADSARIEQLKTACAKAPSGANVWSPGAGDPSSKDFGMPDLAKCQKASSCSANQYFDGASCVGSSPSPTYIYSPYPTSPGVSLYSCFYPNASKNGRYPGYTIWCERDYFNCHEGSKTGSPISLDGLSLGAPSSCESGWTTTPYPTYTGGTSCSQSLISLLGAGCHQMYYDSAGKPIFCNGEMTKSAKEGETSTTAGCSYSGGTYTPYPTIYGDCRNNTAQSSCSVQPGCQWFTQNGSSFCEGNNYIPPTTVSGCPSGYHYHSESSGFCMNDQENYSGTCYNSAGTGKISCPQPTYTPPPSCPSGQWWDYSTNSCKSSNVSGGSCPSGAHTMSVNSAPGYCMLDSDTTKCGPLNSTSTGGFGSCSSYQGSTYSPYPTYTNYSYTPPPSCPSGQWWDPSINTCKSTSPSDTPSYTYTYSPYPTYSYSYTPPPSCASGQWWDYSTNSCQGSTYTYTPYPTYESTPYPTYESTPYPTYSESPPPTSVNYDSYMVAHCQQLDRTWDGRICQANGLFARVYESYVGSFANILRVFGF